ncbi:ABC transporter ATP-binding protein [Cetobacterium sp.]|uniref:ABC transporter ATP-binding protein n=1 Tax=Cetobacterium sp. TaxID=2071632 RepID=UPI003AEF20D1
MKIKNLSYKHRQDFSLKNISFQVKRGEILGILGSNGSGKTTLIKNILGVLRGEGDITLNGSNIQSIPLNKRKNILSYVPQESQVNNLTVFDTIMLGRIPYMRYKQNEKNIKIVDELLVRFNLNHFKNRKINFLSGGEKQRCYIARAIAQNSEVLILDEPTSSLDIANAINILSIIKEIVKEKNIRCIIIIHDLNLAYNFCNTFLFLKNGEQIYFGSKDNCFKKEIIDNLYNIDMNIYKIKDTFLVGPKIET